MATFTTFEQPLSRDEKIRRLTMLAHVECGHEFENGVVHLADILCIFNATIIVGDLPADMQLQMVSHSYGLIAGAWKLKDDNLLHQSDACIDFIWQRIPQNQ